jgi:hypothetical protein
LPGPRDYSKATRAALVDVARGTCYYPDCQAPLIAYLDGEPYIAYEIAHIRDANPGNRYDEQMTDDERRAYRNLILLCKPHHELVDNRHPERFTVADLEGWKAAREGEARSVLEDIGPVDEATLEELLRNAAVGATFVDSTVSLGGEGGRAPGAGGGGGGAIGPDAIGGEGGSGGDAVSGVIRDIEPGTRLHLHVGKGGVEGEAGEDTWVAVEGPDGELEEILRAKGGRGGRSGAAARDDREGPALQVTSAFLADEVQLRDELLFVLGGGWSHWRASAFPTNVHGTLVLVIEPVVEGPRVSELLIEVAEAGAEPTISERVAIEVPHGPRPIRLKLAYSFLIEVPQPGTWEARVQSGSIPLATVPFRVILA